MAEQNINVAQQDTLEIVASNVNTINTNAARLTAARATKIDNIGATSDTGGSTTAGTTMGKLNKVITDVTTLLTNYTSTRAGYIDNIRSYTVTNNTASKTGVLSAKLAYIISLLENTTYGLSAIKNTSSSSVLYKPGSEVLQTIVSSTLMNCSPSTGTATWKDISFISTIEGTVTISADLSYSGRNNAIFTTSVISSEGTQKDYGFAINKSGVQTVDIPIKKGYKIMFQMTYPTGGAGYKSYCNSLKICGSKITSSDILVKL